MKLEFFKGEHIDRQVEKDQAYRKAGFELEKQTQDKQGLVVRVYEK